MPRLLITGMSGRELAGLLHAAHLKLKVLFTPDYTDQATVHYKLLEDRTAFLQKPFTPLALLRKVREVLGSA